MAPTTSPRLINRDEPCDEALIALVQRADQRAFDVLHARYRGLARHVARAVLGTSGGAFEDVVQESFLAVWRRSGQFDSRRGSVRSWLTGLVRNHAIDALRREQAERRRRGRAEELAARHVEVEPAFAALDGTERAHALRAAIESLPRDQYRVMDMAYYLELPQSTIAELLGCPLGTIKGRSRLGLARLRETLRPAA